MWRHLCAQLKQQTMRKYLTIGALGLLLVFVQGCGTEGKEKATTPMTTAERHAQVEKERVLLAEKRKAELAELIATSQYYEGTTGNRVYYKAEIEPAYVGGEAALKAFLKENLEFPAAAKRADMEGTVFVDFIVSKRGEVTGVTASEDTYEEVDDLLRGEALRVVNLMPDWTPGKQNGEAVDVKFSVPITFLIQ